MYLNSTDAVNSQERSRRHKDASLLLRSGTGGNAADACKIGTPAFPLLCEQGCTSALRSEAVSQMEEKQPPLQDVRNEFCYHFREKHNNISKSGVDASFIAT